MSDAVFAIVLAGGKGTRLWPLSRQKHPKHVVGFRGLLPRGTLLQQTMKRIGPIFGNQMVIATLRSHLKEVRSQAPRLPLRQFSIEEESKNTAVAIGLALLKILDYSPEAIVATINSDASVRMPRAYQQALKKAIARVRLFPKHLLLVGVPPKYPDVGLGYIIGGKPARSKQRRINDCYYVESFVEKPSINRARAMIKRKHVFWNPTIIVARAKTFWDAFERHLPDLASRLKIIHHLPGASKYERVRLFRALPIAQIDYAILEKEQNLIVMDGGDMGWRDIGQWGTMLDLLMSDQRKQWSVGKHLDNESKRLLVYNSSHQLVATAGLEDMIVIATPDVFLVVHKEHAHDVKQLVMQLERSNVLRRYA